MSAAPVPVSASSGSGFSGEACGSTEPGRQARSEAEQVLWLMQNGWSLTYNPPWSALTDEANVANAWTCRRTVAPFRSDRPRSDGMWNGPTAAAALAKSILELGAENPKIAALAAHATPAQAGQDEQAEFEVLTYSGDHIEAVASCSGPREQAMKEAERYAGGYVSESAKVEIVEVHRTLIASLSLKGSPT